MYSGVTPSHRAVWCEELAWLHAEANKEQCIWVRMFMTDKDDENCATVNDPESPWRPAPKARNGRQLTNRGSGASKGTLMQALALILDESIEEEDEVHDDDVRIVVGHPQVKGRSVIDGRGARLHGPMAGGPSRTASTQAPGKGFKKEKRSRGPSVEAVTPSDVGSEYEHSSAGTGEDDEDDEGGDEDDDEGSDYQVDVSDDDDEADDVHQKKDGAQEDDEVDSDYDAGDDEGEEADDDGEEEEDDDNEGDDDEEEGDEEDEEGDDDGEESDDDGEEGDEEGEDSDNDHKGV
ncbi:hypothetical protein BU14_0025s0001 [Porphyra umbilicalis]|uniref:Uncharacterized protein n=1 Tax=Porphyra umbilicalis TaxID=2786 RepID=A0A1X6PJU0_PORUM|nr:hypothetical protein BU14_0025s0001 [Porphyra umbilicalis]|eukprot:OSX81117.1 hypothetical protein BU14_0025s0001 [Porphyra umbilicalis]